MNEPFILPGKSRVLEIAESIGNTLLDPTIGDAEEAERLLTQLIDECYRQRDEIERLYAENAALKQSKCQVCEHLANQGAYYEGRSYVEHPIIDDAMVERACKTFESWPGSVHMRAALEAALNGGK